MAILSGRVGAGKTSLMSFLAKQLADLGYEVMFIPLSSSPVIDLKTHDSKLSVISDYYEGDDYYPGYVASADLDTFLSFLSLPYTSYLSFDTSKSNVDNSYIYYSRSFYDFQKIMEKVEKSVSTGAPLKEETSKDSKPRIGNFRTTEAYVPIGRILNATGNFKVIRGSSLQVASTPQDLLITWRFPGIGLIFGAISLEEKSVEFVYMNSRTTLTIGKRKFESLSLKVKDNTTDVNIPDHVRVSNTYSLSIVLEPIDDNSIMPPNKRPIVLIDSLDNVSNLPERLASGGVNLGLLDYVMGITNKYLNGNRLNHLLSLNMPSEHLGEIRRKAQRFYHTDIENVEYDIDILLRTFKLRSEDCVSEELRRCLYVPTESRNFLKKYVTPTDLGRALLRDFVNNVIKDSAGIDDLECIKVDAEMFLSTSKANAEISKTLLSHLTKERVISLVEPITEESYPTIQKKRDKILLTQAEQRQADTQKIAENAAIRQIEEQRLQTMSSNLEKLTLGLSTTDIKITTEIPPTPKETSAVHIHSKHVDDDKAITEALMLIRKSLSPVMKNYSHDNPLETGEVSNE